MAIVVHATVRIGVSNGDGLEDRVGSSDCHVVAPTVRRRTLGKGGYEPRRTEHIFNSHSLAEGARIDFLRGIASDDRGKFD